MSDERYAKARAEARRFRWKYLQLKQAVVLALTEIRAYEADCNLSSPDENCKACNKVTFDSIVRIIEKNTKNC